MKNLASLVPAVGLVAVGVIECSVRHGGLPRWWQHGPAGSRTSSVVDSRGACGAGRGLSAGIQWCESIAMESAITAAGAGQEESADGRTRKHGVSNERLDEVSYDYRCNGSAGETWKHSTATATAIIMEGKVTGFTITNAGAGYLIASRVSVVGYGDVEVEATIEFSNDFKTNGRVTSLTVL